MSKMKIINKKAFTLVELLAVIALLAVLTGIAVPNVISTINNNKKNSFLLDAKRLVVRAESIVSSNREVRNEVITNSKRFTFAELNESGEFPSDPDSSGNTYQEGYVEVSYQEESFKYCLYLKGVKRRIGTSGACIDSNLLTGIDIIEDN